MNHIKELQELETEKLEIIKNRELISEKEIAREIANI